MNKKLASTLAALALIAGLGLSSAYAVDNMSSTDAPDLTSVRAKIKAKDYAGALAQLRELADDVQHADVYNLMGFTLRKGRTPDLAGSEKYYDAALRIDPHHRNTLEYSGELYLMKGDLPRAQGRLAALQAECGGQCEQFTQLRTAIADYQAHGNKFVSTGW